MSSIIEVLSSAKQLGRRCWLVKGSQLDSKAKQLVVREIFGVSHRVAEKRLELCRSLALGQVNVPVRLVSVDQRLFVISPWVEGQALEPIVTPAQALEVLKLAAAIPEQLAIYDFRPEHLLQTDQGLRLVDIGWNPAGCNPYASPEQNGRGQVSSACLVYQVGVTLHQLLNNQVLPDALTLLIPEVEPALIDSLPSSLAELINSMLEGEARNRPSLRDVEQQFASWVSFRKVDADILDPSSSANAKVELSKPAASEESPEFEAKSTEAEVSAAGSRMISCWTSEQRNEWVQWGIIIGSALLIACLVGLSVYVSLPKAVTPTRQPLQTTSSIKPTGETLPQSFISKTDGSRMILVPAGVFYAGPPPQAGVGAQPVAKDLPAFYIDRFEVTNRQFAKFVEVTGYKANGRWQAYATSDRLDHPVICVSWYDAQAYAAWAHKRLPTGDEWEKAARGGDGRHYPWGNGWDRSRLNCFESNVGNTCPVGSYPAGASPYGVEDMAGNVWEWVDAWYLPLGKNTEDVPMLRAARGGSRSDAASECTVVSVRGVFPESMALVSSGFRCVMDPEPGSGSKNRHKSPRPLPSQPAPKPTVSPLPNEAQQPLPGAEYGSSEPAYSEPGYSYPSTGYGYPQPGSAAPGAGYHEGEFPAEYEQGDQSSQTLEPFVPGDDKSHSTSAAGSGSARVAPARPSPVMKTSSEMLPEDDGRITGEVLLNEGEDEDQSAGTE